MMKLYRAVIHARCHNDRITPSERAEQRGSTVIAALQDNTGSAAGVPRPGYHDLRCRGCDRFDIIIAAAIERRTPRPGRNVCAGRGLPLVRHPDLDPGGRMHDLFDKATARVKVLEREAMLMEAIPGHQMVDGGWIRRKVERMTEDRL